MFIIDYFKEITGGSLLIAIDVILIFTFAIILFCSFIKTLKDASDYKKKILKFLEDEKHDKEILNFKKDSFNKSKEELIDVIDEKNGKILDANEIFEFRIFVSHGKESLYKSIINAFTGLGLFGTFIGLRNSIAGSNIVGSESAISKIVDALEGALGTSILGVAFSIFFSIFLSIIIYRCRELSFELSTKLMKLKNNTNPNYFYNDYINMSAEKYTKGVDKIVSKFMDNMKSELQSDLDSYKNALKESVDQLKESHTEYKKLFTSQNDVMIDLNNYLDRVDGKVREYEDYIKKLTTNYDENLEKLIKGMDSVRKSYDEIVETNKLYQESIVGINKNGVEENKKILEMLQNELKNVSEQFDNMKNISNDFNTNMLNAPEQFNNAMTEAIEKFENELEKLSKRLEKNSI